MGVLANAKHELFAQEVAKGTPLEKAYVKAGYKPDPKNAARLTKKDGVRTRIDEIMTRAASKVEVTIADIARQLDEDRDFARACKTPSPSAAVAATMGKAKVLGLIVDRQAGADGGPVRVVAKVEWSVVDPQTADSEGV